jgi:PncC family amidohydrolase
MRGRAHFDEEIPHVSPRRREFVENESPLLEVGEAFISELESRRITEVARTEALEQAFSLKKLLANNNLNIITAESLTAGLICSTLVDVPGEGSVIMGGIVAYDTDLKRQLLQVSTKGVYSILTSQQMAANALDNSRAMISLAVSGNAMPYPVDKSEIGIVYIGVALRTRDKILVYGNKVSICDKKQVENMCSAWKSLNTVCPDISYAPYQLTAVISDYIRNKTVAYACMEASRVIKKELYKGIKWGTVPNEPYDLICKPSPVILSRLEKEIDYSSDCKGTDVNMIDEIAYHPLKTFPQFI